MNCALCTVIFSSFPVRVTSVSIMLYLAEKYNRFLPSDPSLKPEVLNWYDCHSL